MGQGDDPICSLRRRRRQAESASVCMFPERKDCMHIFSTEGRAFFAVWLQAVERDVCLDIWRRRFGTRHGERRWQLSARSLLRLRSL